MNNAIDDIISKKTKMPENYAVVFADLNGLKRVNDEKGHNAIDSDIHFAFGYHFVGNGEDIHSAMRIADNRMNINKNEYYAQNPEKKYR